MSKLNKILNYSIIAFVIVFLASLTLLYFNNSNSFYPDEKIQELTNQYAFGFEKKAQKVEQTLFDLKSIIDSSNIQTLSSSQLLDILMLKLENNESVKGYICLEHGKKLTIVEKNQNSFAYAIDTTLLTNNVQWYRIDKKHNVLNSWTRALGVEINILNWEDDVFNDSYKYNLPIWTSVDRMLDNNTRNIAVHFTWRSKSSKELITCVAMVNQFSDLYFLPFKSKAEFKSYIVDIDNSLIPFTSNYPKDTVYSRFDQTVLNSWLTTKNAIPITFNFSFKEQDFWGQSLKINLDGINGILLVAEDDTLNLAILLTNRNYFIVALSALISILILLLLRFKKKKNSVDKYISKHTNDTDVSDLIKEGEGNHLEFKSSFRYDLNLNTVNKELEYVIAKSIAAFSNAKGGTLLIGVDDLGNILGLENDIITLKRKDIDFFENYLRSFLNKVFSVAFVSSNLQINFPVVDHKVICRIDIIAGKEPVFIEILKNSKKTEKFYLRSGNTSMDMLALSEINKYIKERF